MSWEERRGRREVLRVLSVWEMAPRSAERWRPTSSTGQRQVSQTFHQALTFLTLTETERMDLLLRDVRVASSGSGSGRQTGRGALELVSSVVHDLEQ